MDYTQKIKFWKLEWRLRILIVRIKIKLMRLKFLIWIGWIKTTNIEVDSITRSVFEEASKLNPGPRHHVTIIIKSTNNPEVGIVIPDYVELVDLKGKPVKVS